MKFFRYLVLNVTIVSAVLTVLFIGMSTQSIEQVERPLPKNSPAAVMTHCDDVPAGTFPTGVVMQHFGGGTYMVRVPSTVDKMFNLAMDKKMPAGVRQMAFCK